MFSSHQASPWQAVLRRSLTTRRVALLTTAALMVGACSSAGSAATPAPSAPPTAQAAVSTPSPAPNVAASMTPAPTATPAEPEANVQVESTTFLHRPTAYDKGKTDAALIIKLVNRGAAPARIDGSSSDYTIYSKDSETVLETGDFLFEGCPSTSSPGEYGYLAQDMVITERDKKVTGAHVEFEPKWETVDEADVRTFSFAKVKSERGYPG